MTNEELIQEIKNGVNVQENLQLLYTQNLPLIKQWSRPYIERFGAEDVLQECYIALHLAVQLFKFDKGFKFTSYLQKCIMRHLGKQLSNYTGVKLGADDKKLLMEYRALNEKWQQATGEDVSEATVCRMLHCSRMQLNRIKQYTSLNNIRSLEEPTGEDISVADLLSSNINIEREYEDKETAEHSAELWGLIDTVLDKRKADVITYRFKHGEAFKQISERMDILVERVRQLESSALGKLRYDRAVKQWALDYYNICFTYGFNTWKNNQGSAVEIALEIAEREERRRRARLDALNDRIQAGYNRARFRRYT